MSGKSVCIAFSCAIYGKVHMGRDSALLEEPSKFMPERFLDCEKSKRDFIGFVAHSFDWTFPDGLSAEETDMDHVFSIVLKKHQE
ncbi:hypothetical protein SUGI_0816790 [Cryptomeria japonica]|nr:hypothetical protein SUGI_0816790 [Cryptomeria japonica]